MLAGPRYVFASLLSICETIGESVASALGLDDSHFQEYIDMMSPEELAQAEEINRQRLAEDNLVATNSLYNGHRGSDQSLPEAVVVSDKGSVMAADGLDVDAVTLTDNSV